MPAAFLQAPSKGSGPCSKPSATGWSLHELAPAQHKAVLDVALDTGLPVYDAAYLWLARSLRLPLATFDAAQAEAATRTGVALLDLSTF